MSATPLTDAQLDLIARHLHVAGHAARVVRAADLDDEEALSAARWGLVGAARTWPGTGSFREYAWAAARSAILAELRSLRRWRRAQRWHAGRRPAATGRVPRGVELTDAADLAGAVGRAADALPDPCREPARLRLAGLEYAEIADRLGLAKTTAHRLAARGLAAVRAAVDAG